MREDVNKLENRFDWRPFTTLKIEKSCFKLFFLEKFLKSSGHKQACRNKFINLILNLDLTCMTFVFVVLLIPKGFFKQCTCM